MTRGAVNLLSDTQTRPSEAMRAVMAAAEVGDEQKFADPTTAALQERVAALLGQEAGLFLPSGTMCNLIALRLHIGPGDEVILAKNSHPVDFEGGSAAHVAGAMLRTIDSPTGMYTAADIEAALREPGNRYQPRSRMISVEQTTNMGGGRVWSPEAVDEVVATAREHGLRAHMDGARLMNAAVAAGVAPERFASQFDTAWLDFSKGLGCPVGAVLVGSRETIEEAWRFKQSFGGALRQSGMLAAAGLFALDHHVDRLAADHEHASRLARVLADAGAGIDPATVDTNIVIFEVPDPAGFCAAAEADGVLVAPAGPGRVRAVTHLDIDDEGLERASDVLGPLAERAAAQR